jgi:hypothetical protein
MVLLPTISGMLWLAVPEVTVVPLTRTEAKELAEVGVTVIADVAFVTVAV